jgi:phage repressor protein C with HTH and peptisase S24 domain
MKIWDQKEEADRLKKRFAKIKNKKKFAEDFEVPGGPSMISQNCSGNRPISRDAALAYARGFNCSLSEISPRYALEAQKISKADALPLEQPNVSTHEPRFPPRPKLNTVPGGGFKEAPDLIHPADAEWIVPRETKGGPWSAWLEIENDSMEPDFKQGDLILVDPDRAADNGDFVVAANGDHHWTFKQLVRDGSDWYLKPLNPRYQNKLLTDDIRIVGRVIEHQPKARKL